MILLLLFTACTSRIPGASLGNWQPVKVAVLPGPCVSDSPVELHCAMYVSPVHATPFVSVTIKNNSNATIWVAPTKAIQRLERSPDGLIAMFGPEPMVERGMMPAGGSVVFESLSAGEALTQEVFLVEDLHLAEKSTNEHDGAVPLQCVGWWWSESYAVLGGESLRTPPIWVCPIAEGERQYYGPCWPHPLAE